MKEVISEYWNKSASTYDHHWGHGIKTDKEKLVWKETLQTLVGREPKKILDVGTGTGFLAVLLAELGHEVVGIDISEGMLNQARSKARRSGLSVDFFMGDAENVPLKDESVEVVISRHLLWTLLQPEKALKEWLRVLKPGGKVVVIDSKWFPEEPVEKVRFFLGRVLKSIFEGKGSWKTWESIYGKDAQKNLPFFGGAHREEVESLFRKAGMSGIESRFLEEIDEVEGELAPFYIRVSRFYRRYAVVGTKQ